MQRDRKRVRGEWVSKRYVQVHGYFEVLLIMHSNDMSVSDLIKLFTALTGTCSYPSYYTRINVLILFS